MALRFIQIDPTLTQSTIDISTDGYSIGSTVNLAPCGSFAYSSNGIEIGTALTFVYDGIEYATHRAITLTPTGGTQITVKTSDSVNADNLDADGNYGIFVGIPDVATAPDQAGRVIFPSDGLAHLVSSIVIDTLDTSQSIGNLFIDARGFGTNTSSSDNSKLILDGTPTNVLAGQGNDTIFATVGAKQFVDGGAGKDSVFIQAHMTDLTFLGLAFNDINIASSTGTVEIKNVELINLYDGSINPSAFGTVAYDSHSPGGQIYALYDGLLGRAPDPLGLEGWTTTLNAGGSIKNIAAGFLSSPEGHARAGAADNATFVEQLYQANLHRASDPGGKAGWVSALDHGTSRGDVALGFALSDEHIANLKGVFDAGLFVPDQAGSNVARLYHGILDHAPDAGGLQGWTSAVKTGTPLHDIAATFLNSSEYEVATTGRTDAQFVTDLYQQVLDRAGDSQGVQGWNGYLDAGGARGVVIDGFTNSFEFQGKYAGQSSATYVEGLYEHILGRPGDSAGLQDWANFIDSGTASRTDVAHAFTGSAEFQAKYVGPGNADFVDDLYENALGRHTDAGSLQGWTDAMAHGISRADVAVAIAESAEAQQHLVSVIEQGWHLA